MLSKRRLNGADKSCHWKKGHRDMRLWWTLSCGNEQRRRNFSMWHSRVSQFRNMRSFLVFNESKAVLKQAVPLRNNAAHELTHTHLLLFILFRTQNTHVLIFTFPRNIRHLPLRQRSSLVPYLPPSLRLAAPTPRRRSVNVTVKTCVNSRKEEKLVARRWCAR
jgi:hypothetical protein